VQESQAAQLSQAAESTTTSATVSSTTATVSIAAVSFGFLVVAAAGEERYAESNSEEKN
jgi:hypothetical protein